MPAFPLIMIGLCLALGGAIGDRSAVADGNTNLPTTAPSPSPSPSPTPSLFAIPGPTPTTPSRGGWTVTTSADGSMRFQNRWNPVNGTALPDGKVFTQAIEQRFDLHVEAAYQGKQYLVQIAPAHPAALFDTAAGGLQTPVCNISTGETSKNHLGQSCGASSCTFEGVCAVCGSPTCPFWLAGHRHTALRDLPVTCEKDRAFKRGAFIQEAIVAKQGVLDQWNAQNDIWIGPKCNSQLWSQASTLVNDWWTQVSAWQALAPGQFDNCNADPVNNFNTAPVQGPCYLVAASQALNFALAEAAVCEIFARAETRWLSYDEPRLEDAAAGFRDGVLATCEAGTPNPSQLMKCANSAYAGGIQKTLASVMPKSGEYAWAPAPDPVYSPPSTAIKPILGLLQCPLGASDCHACQGDAVACPEAGQAFLNAELGGILQTHVDLQVSADNMLIAQTYLSAVPAYAPSPSPFAYPTPSNSYGAQLPPPTTGASPAPSPSLSPTLSLGAPSPTPASVVPAYPNMPAVNVITFPGAKP